MDEISALLHDARGERLLTLLWQRASGCSTDFASEEELARRANSAAQLRRSA